MTSLQTMDPVVIARIVTRMRKRFSVRWIAAQLERSPTWVYRMLRRGKDLPPWPVDEILVGLTATKD